MPLIFNKKAGETPLEALTRLRKEQPALEKETLSYAGRLDPLAEGLMLVLLSEENKNRQEYLGLDKEYDLEVLLGFKTDTGDALGLVTDAKIISPISERAIQETLENIVGKQQQQYPAYSSKTVNGIPLHILAREGKLPEEMPSQEIEIYSVKLVNDQRIPETELFGLIRDKIHSVHGDFRQQEIMKQWQATFSKPEFTAHHKHHNVIRQFQVVKLKVKCSAGSYMRTLAETIGNNLNCPALALSIARTRIGEYAIVT